MAEMKSDTEKMMKFDWLYKVGSECELNSWLDRAQLVRASERNSVVVGSNLLRLTFYSYFKESYSGEYHLYIYIYIYDYRCNWLIDCRSTATKL